MDKDTDLFGGLHGRLDALERDIGRLRAKRHEDPEMRRTAEGITAQARAIRERLDSTPRASWPEMRREIEAEWSSLQQTFGRWSAEVDAHFRDPGNPLPGSTGG